MTEENIFIYIFFAIKYLVFSFYFMWKLQPSEKIHPTLLFDKKYFINFLLLWLDYCKN